MKTSKAQIRLYMWTDHFLGSPEKARGFLHLIRTLDGGKWIPEKWSQFEPVRETFSSESDASLIAKWTEARQGRISNLMFFKKARPKFFLNVTVWKGKVPDLNYLYCDLEAEQFKGAEGVERLKRIIGDLAKWSNPVYATAYHSLQVHDRSAPGNPMQRLERINWLSFFGDPYLKMFGEERIRNCGFHSCERVANGLLLTASEAPDSEAMIESSTRLIQIENCLGRNAFACDGYPEISCVVPSFDTRATVNFH